MRMLVGVSAVIVRLSMENNIGHEVSWTVGTNADSLQPACRQACDLPSASMIELLSIHLWGDACYAPEGSREVRHIAIPHTIPNISHSHAGVL